MKGAVLLAALLWQAAAANGPPVAGPETLRYERAVRVGAGDRQESAGQACAVLDAEIFPHAAPSLTDLRLFAARDTGVGDAVRAGAAREVPYTITLSEAVGEESETARVLNLVVKRGAGNGSARFVFDLEMPRRAYTDVALVIDPAVHDFVATAAVSGTDALGGGGKATALGTFTLFDLASQHLSRNTTIPLAEARFRYLHVVLDVSPAPGGETGTARGAGPGSSARLVPAMVLGAQVPPSREAQTVYTTVAETATIAQVGGESVARFAVPARVPVERISFVLAPGPAGNFSRAVRATALAETTDAAGRAGDSATNDGVEEMAQDEDARAPLAEIVTGSILRVHASEAGREIRTEQLSIPAVLGANLQRAAKVEVAIENGDLPPLPIAAVRLEMRQRKICFEAPDAASTGHGPGAGSGLALFYGDAARVAPEYAYARRFVAARSPLVAELGPEEMNPNYRMQRAEERPFAERHPELRWIALIAAICALGVVALRSAKNAEGRR